MEGLGMGKSENRKKREWPDSMDAVEWEVEPMAGWKPNAPNGLLRHDPGDECRLVRLVDLAAWLGDQYPRDEVVRRLIVPLHQNNAEPWGLQLFVLNGRGYAKRLFDHFDLSIEPEVISCWQHLHEPDSVSEYGEYVERNYSPNDVIGVIGRMWQYAWPGVAENPDADDHWFLRRVYEANMRRNERAKAFPDMQHRAAPSSMFSEERRDMMRVLERLAVPVPIAFTLWGWGSVAAAVAQPAAVPSATAAPGIQTQDIAPAIGPQDVADWPSLVRYRQQFVGVPPQQRPAWLLEYVAILARWVRDECAAGRSYGVLDRAGKALGFTNGVRVRQLLKDHGFDAAGQEVALSAGNPWGGLGNKRRHSA